MSAPLQVSSLQVQGADGRWVQLGGVRTLEHSWMANPTKAQEDQSWTCVRCGLTEGLVQETSVCPGYQDDGPSAVALRDLKRRNAIAWWRTHGRRAH